MAESKGRGASGAHRGPKGQGAGRQGARGAKGRGPKGPKQGARGQGSKGPKQGARGQGTRGHSGRRPSHAPHREGAAQGVVRPERVRGDVVEGRRAVAEALEADVAIRRAFVSLRSGAGDETLERLVRELGDRGVFVESVPKAFLDRLSYHGTHQGIAVEVEPFHYAELSELIARAGTGDALVVCLDHVEDEGNLGAIARGCECAGAVGIVVPERRSASVGVGAYKTSAGALMRLPVARVTNMAQAVEELKRAGFWCVAATEHADNLLWESDIAGRLAVVMGGEHQGVSRLVRERCDEECALPQMGEIESLNVAQAATVFAYEWLRQTMARDLGPDAPVGEGGAPVGDDGADAPGSGSADAPGSGSAEAPGSGSAEAPGSGSDAPDGADGGR